MRGTRVITIITSTFLCLVVTIAAGTDSNLSQTAAIRIAHSDRAETAVAAMKQLAAAGALDQLVYEIDRTVARTDITIVEQDRLIFEGLRLLSTLAPTDSAWQLADSLAATVPRTYVLHEEGRGRTIPLYDIGAQPRWLRRHWLSERTHNEALARIRAADPAVLDVFDKSLSPDAVASERNGVEQAFRSADANELLSYRDDVILRLYSGDPVENIAIRLARELSDKEIFAAIARSGKPEVAVRMMGEVPTYLTSADSLDVLTIGAGRIETASAALLAMSPLVHEVPGASEFLITQLANPDRGPSAATALARAGDGATILRLRAILNSGKDGPAERHAVLALRLNNSTAAQAAIESYLNDPQASTRLKKEMSAW